MNYYKCHDCEKCIESKATHRVVLDELNLVFYLCDEHALKLIKWLKTREYNYTVERLFLKEVVVFT